MATASQIPWPALQAFREAARLGSFREAALQLGVTPSAVSHQIKRLEQDIGGPLFERGVRQVRLTETGRRLAEKIHGALSQIELAVAQARQEVQPSRLSITALPLFAWAWLGKRLADFEARFPALTISIDTSSRVLDLAAGEADVAIRNVLPGSAQLWSRKLMDLRAVPVCTPELGAQINDLSDLAQQRLIGLNIGRSGWDSWFEAVGAPHLKPERVLLVDTMAAGFDAALQGRGVALALSPLVWDTPAASGLIVPLAGYETDAGSYYVTCRKSDRDNPVIGAFVDWLCSEVQADLRRLRKLGSVTLRSPLDTKASGNDQLS